MTDDRLAEVLRLVEEALGREGEARAAYLDAACAGDAALRAEIDSLLAQRSEDGGFPGSPPWASDERSPLASGTRLGPYEIEAFIGAGGMGQVYRARDTRLGRTVAVKVLPPGSAADPECRRRFEHEARAASALNHPHICTLHDIGQTAGVDYLVLELLEGETLAARLAKGPLPLEKALTTGAEIAEALAAAHRQGVVHRDLKPANVMLTESGAKLLDFGLAKLRGHGELPMAASLAPTAVPSSSLTAAGTIVGTLPYMAPEQLEGKPADARTDIWALGTILYEMMTGRRAFAGDSRASLVTAIMSAEPPSLAAVKPLTPRTVERIVWRCLAKDPDKRWESAADLAQELRWLAEAEMPASAPDQAGRPRRVVTRALYVAIGGMFGTFAAWLLLTRPAPSPTHMTISISESHLRLSEGGVTISPDGRAIVFAARGRDSEARLYVRRFDEREARPIEGTQGARRPFFSPDGEWVAFTSARGLQKVPSRGGPSQLICLLRAQYGGRWSSDGRIVFADTGGLWIVSAEGGTPVRHLPLPDGLIGVRYLDPELLPGDAGVAFTVWREGHASVGAIARGTTELRTLIQSGTRPRCLRTGHLVYESGGQLMAAVFDPRRLEPPAAPRVVVGDIGTDFLGSGIYDVSPTGTLAYVPGSTTRQSLVWRDRAGRGVPLKLQPRSYSTPVLSSDGRRLVVCVREGASRSLWTGSVEGEPLTRLTFAGDDWFGLFTPDGREVLFTSPRQGRYNIWRTPADGSRRAERVTDSPFAQKATSFSPNGAVLLFNQADAGHPESFDIRQMAIDPVGESRPLLDGTFSEVNGALSPDGRWVAYTSNETGAHEVYVTAFPGPGPRRRVSVEGGVAPAWNPRGGELVYQGRDALMAVRIADGLAIGSPTALFPHPANRNRTDRDWDVAPDGQRFLMVEHQEDVPVSIVLNWFEEMKTKLPARR